MTASLHLWIGLASQHDFERRYHRYDPEQKVLERDQSVSDRSQSLRAVNLDPCRRFHTVFDQ